MNEPLTCEELMDFILDNLSGIYVREQVNGKWDAYSLDGLPGDKAIGHAFRFLREGQKPIAIRKNT